MILLSSVDMWDAQIRAWGEAHSPSLELLLRLVAAAVAGGLVGLERERRGRQAGFRTTMLVCIGSALTMIVSVSFALRAWPHEVNVNVNIDPARIAYGVMTGIGFLGAGTIIKDRGRVNGLTTAAALWSMAAVGLAAGFGMYVLTAMATTLILVILFVLNYFDDFVPKLGHREVVVRRKWEAGCVEETVRYFKAAGLRVVGLSFERSGDLSFADIALQVAFHNRDEYYELMRKLESDARYIILATRDW